jgi:predicted NAD/FAD-binding protein
LVHASFDYEHPVYDRAAIRAQGEIAAIQGMRRTWFAGAWLGYGFHEDGLTAGLRVARALGGRTPWRFVDHRIEGGPLEPVEPVREGAVA